MPRRQKQIISLILLAFFLLLPVRNTAAQRRQYVITGETMGTFYTVKFISSQEQSIPVWQEKIDTCLSLVNKHLSMFDPTSELGRFNVFESNKPFRVSTGFMSVLEIARHIHSITQGAFDPTVKPLVDLWGFGTHKGSLTIPDADVITRLLRKTGFEHIQFEPDRTILKTRIVTLDLSAIAKGYGVEAVKKILTDGRIKNALVEIGGELSACGKNMKYRNWSVGINTPSKKVSQQGLYRIVKLDNNAIATSGNYRNFIRINGKDYSHIIDPDTGYPVENAVVSASVIAKTCTFADGLATGLMVMDIKDGIALVNQLEDTECLIIEKKNGRFVQHVSKGFAQFVVR